jgi:gliding motility-associated-like protein
MYSIRFSILKIAFVLIFFLCSNVIFCQASLKSCYVGEDKYLCSSSVSLSTNSLQGGSWKKSILSTLQIDNVNSPSIIVSGISRPIDTLIWTNIDNSCIDTLLLITPKIGATQFTFFGKGEVLTNEITLCYGDSWFASTPLTQGLSNVAYVLYKSEPKNSIDIFNDSEAFQGPVILANNDLNDGTLSNRYPLNNQEYWFVPILFHSVNAQGPVIDPTCQITGTPFKIKYLNKISISKVEDCMLGNSEIIINGGSPQFHGGNYNIKSLLPTTATINQQQILLGEKLKISLLNPGDIYSFTIRDNVGCEQNISEKFLPCPACKTDVIYKSTYCITDDNPLPQLKNGTGIGVLTLTPSVGLVFDSITGKLFINQSSPGRYVLKNTSSPSCQSITSTDFIIELKDTIPLPIGPTIDTICISNPRVGDIEGVSGQFITWYNESGDILDVDKSAVINGEKYYCTQTISGCESNKIAVEVFAPVVMPPMVDKVQFICSSILNPTINNLFPNGKSIFWYKKDKTLLKDNDIIIPGEYYVTQNIGCESKQIEVSVLQDNTALPNTIEDTLYYCFNDYLIVDSLIPSGVSFNWYDLPNATSPLLSWQKIEQGTYYITAINTITKCESNKKKVRVFVSNIDVDFSIINPKCGFNDGMVISSISGGIEPYSISFNNELITSLKVINIQSGTYPVKITDNSQKLCKLDTMLTIGCNKQELQSILTPNNDGKNDKLIFGFITSYPNSKVNIYNRWGHLVYESDIPYPDNWEGVSNINNKTGNLLPSGTYYYLIDKGNGEAIISGYLELVTKE